MRKYLLISLLGLFSSSLFTACSDDDDPVTPPSKGEVQIQEVVKELEKIVDVKDFTALLKSSTASLNIEDDKLTVIAVKSFNPLKSTAESSKPELQVLKRHIIKGTHDLSALTGNETELKSIANDILYVTKSDGKVLINGIPLNSAVPVKAGDSYIYISDETIPDAKDITQYKNKITIKVLECNETWSAENNVEATASSQAIVTFYNKKNNEYVFLERVQSDDKGEAVLNHNYSGELYYAVAKDDKKFIYGGYIPVGVFTSQSQIDSYPEYRTNSGLDFVSPGSIKIQDINGDGIIDEQDKVDLEYFSVEENDEIIVYLVSPAPLYADDFIKLEDVPKINDTLDEIFAGFFQAGYVMDYDLTKPNVSYPKISEYFYRSSTWENGYKYINFLLNVTDKLEIPNYPKYIINEWNKTSGKHWEQFAYIYSVLVSYYGDVPLITKKMDVVEAVSIPRSPHKEVIQFIESIADKTASDLVIKSMLARYYMNNKDVTKAYNYLKEITNSGQYSLLPAKDVFNNQSNNEVILGGYPFTANIDFAKGKYAHLIRYSEIILSLAECAIERENVDEAVEYLNSYYSSQGMSSFSGEMSTDKIKEAVRTTIKNDMSNEGINFMLINRWDILLQELGVHGAQSYNKLLPIPLSEVNYNPNINQNPGY